jgi:hypothetical protein
MTNRFPVHLSTPYKKEREGTSDPNESFSDEGTEMGRHLNQEELDSLIS